MEDDKTMKIFINYRIDVILKKYKDGDRSAEVNFLMEKIDDYKEKANKKIRVYLDSIKGFPKTEAMKWISTNAEEELAPYVRMAYLGSYREDGVLKQSPDRYKTISAIGIEVAEIDQEMKIENWFREWNKQAEKTGNIKIFESHAHYNLTKFKKCYQELLPLMHKKGHISTIINPAIEYSTIAQMKSMFDAPQYSYILYAFGSHPKYLWKEAGLWTSERWKEYLSLIKSDPKCVSVGEVGLDYSYPEFNTEHQSMQQDFLIKFIGAANEAGLPVILHIRPASHNPESMPDPYKDALQIIQNHPIKFRACYHCFGGSLAKMKDFIDAGVCYFGIGGRITYDEEQLNEAVKNAPLECLLIETDSPFIPIRAKESADTNTSLPNTSLSLYHIASKIGELRGISTEDVLRITYENGKRLFRIQE